MIVPGTVPLAVVARLALNSAGQVPAADSTTSPDLVRVEVRYSVPRNTSALMTPDPPTSTRTTMKNASLPPSYRPS